MKWTEIVTKHIETYRMLEEKWTPKENKPDKLQTLQEELNQLKTQIKNNNHRNNNDEGGCWDCGKKGEKRGHSGCKTPNASNYVPE